MEHLKFQGNQPKHYKEWENSGKKWGIDTNKQKAINLLCTKSKQLKHLMGKTFKTAKTSKTIYLEINFKTM